MPTPLTIWSNAKLPTADAELLRHSLAPHHRLVESTSAAASNLVAGDPDPAAREADVLFGQPHPDDVVGAAKLKLVQLTSAGYARYETPAVKEALKSRGAALCSASQVYAEPCAEHAAAMILAFARQLPRCVIDQATARSWAPAPIRADCHLVTGQTLLILGFGAIGSRLAELLAPWKMNLLAFRRTPRGDEPIPTHPDSRIDDFLPQADHVVNILPGTPATASFFNAARFSRMKRGSRFYNIGRGTTVDQAALIAALESNHLDAAYLDVTDPEPLPPAHPLWQAPNCHITPHTAGGHSDEFTRQVRELVENINRLERNEPLIDRVS